MCSAVAIPWRRTFAKPNRCERRSGGEDRAGRGAGLRASWPNVRILLRADSGFAPEALMAWCEANRVDYLFDLARNPRLATMIESELAAAEAAAEARAPSV